MNATDFCKYILILNLMLVACFIINWNWLKKNGNAQKHDNYILLIYILQCPNMFGIGVVYKFKYQYFLASILKNHHLTDWLYDFDVLCSFTLHGCNCTAMLCFQSTTLKIVLFVGCHNVYRLFSEMTYNHLYPLWETNCS